MAAGAALIPSAARRALAAQRRAQALDLVLGGATYEQAGRAIGISAQAAHQAVQKALDEGIRQRIKDGAEKLREVHHKRYEAIILAQWGKRGDPKHATTVLKAMEQQARLNGLTVDEVLMRTSDETPTAGALDTSSLSIEDKRQLRTLLLRASVAPATIDVTALEVVGGNGKSNGHGANGNGTHALEMPLPEVIGEDE